MSVKGRKRQGQDFTGIATLERLLEVSQSLIVVRDLGSLLQKIAESAGAVLKADVIVLYQYHEEIDDVTVPPVVWGKIQQPEVLGEIGRVRPHKKSAVFKMLERAEPFYASNARKDWAQLIEGWSQEEGSPGNFVYREGIVSSAAVRLATDAERVGVLFVNYRTHHTFPEEGRKIIELLATQAAIAIHNARLFKEAQEQVNQLSALVETAQVINRFTDLDSIFEPVFEQAFTLVGKEVSWIALVDRGTQILRIVASRGIPQERIEAFHNRPTYAYEGTFGLVMQTGEIQEFPDAKHDERVLDLDLPIPEQLTNIPLKVEGQVIGILTLDALIPNEQARQSLMALADMTALAIDKARLFEQNVGLIRSLKQRNEELQALNKIGQTVSAKGVEEVVKLVYEETSRLMDTTNFFIGLYDRDKEELNIEIWMHRGQPLEKFSTTVSGLTGWVIEKKKPLLIRDWDEEEDDFPVQAEIVTERQRSWLGVPLVIGEEVLGVMSVQSPRPNAFDSDTQQLLEIIANQAAVAIENARLFDSAHHRIRDLEIVNEVVQAISTRLKAEDLLQTIVSQIADKLDCTHCTLFFPQEEKGELFLVPQVTYGVRSKEIMTRRFKLDEGLAGWVFQNQESLVLGDAKKDKRFAHAREKREQPRSMLVAPVKVGDQTIGVISADQDAFGWFSESDRRLIDALAQQAGIAIQRAIGLALLQDIGTRTISAPRVDDILQEIVSGAIKLTNTTSGIIYLVSGDGKSVTDRFSYPPGFDHPEPRMASEESITRQVIKTGEMLIFRDAHQDARVNPVLYNRVRSMIAIPLKLEQKVIGVLFLNDANRHDFTETETSLLSTLASQAAIAIQNARLLQQERNLALRQTSLLRHLQEVSRLALAGDYTDLADYAVEAAHDLTGAEVILWMMSERDGERGQVLRIAAGRGESVDENYVLEAKMPVTPGSSITALALERGESIVREDILEDLEKPEFYHIEEARRRGWHSFMAIPLLGLGGGRLGSLNLRSKDIAAFGEFEIGLMRTFANQVALAFENVQTVQKLDTQLESLHRVVQEESLGKVLEQILKGINTILGEGTSSSISLYDETSGSFGPSTAVGPLADLLRVPPRAKSGTGRHVLETREAYYLDDVTKPPSGCPTIRDALAEQNPIKSFAALPLKRQDRIVGVLFVNLQVPISFSAGVRRVLELFASQAAVAIENARLFQELDDRAERLVRLQEITATISAKPSDLAKLLDSIVGSLRDIFRGASCAIRLYDSRKDEFGPRVAVGAVQDLVDHTPRPEGTSRYLVQTQQPLYIEDVSATPPDGVPILRREVLALDIRAAAYLPLLSEGQVIGILYMDLTESRQFSQYDKQVLELFANQAAIAIKNARLLQDLDERATQLLRLQEVTAAISAEPSDFEKVLDLIVASLNGMFGGASCAIRLYDSESNEFKQREAVGELEHLWRPIRPGGTSWSVVKTKTPLYVEDTLATPPDGQPSVREEFIERGVKAIAYLPLISKENAIGILYLNLTAPHQFSQDEKLILKLFADQAAIAIENARLFEQLAHANKQLDRRVQELEVLTEIGRTVSNLAIDQILDLVYEQAGKIMDLSDAQVQIAFYDEAKDEVSFPLAVEQDGGNTIDVVRWSQREAQYREEGEDEVVEQFKPRTRRDPPGLNEYVIRTKKPLLIVEDFEQRAAKRHIKVWPTFGRQDRPTHSWLGVPMMVASRVIGVISIQSLEQEHAFDEGQQELLTTVASQAAVAIENARLYQDLKSAQSEIADKERDLVTISLAMDLVHRMNNVAGPIAPWVTLIKRELSSESRQNPKVTRYLDQIVRDAALILQEAHELRTPIAEPGDVNVEELIGSIVGQIAMMTSPDIRVVFEYEPELPRVRAVERQLSIAVYSVAENAIRAISGQGQISIELRRDSDELGGEKHIRINISDTGCGIPAARLDSIFEYGTSYWSDGKGTGYGLWRARSIIQSIGGSISVTKSILGEGSTFTIVLPTVEANADTAGNSRLEQDNDN